MNVVRIKDGIVINIEVADQAWIDANEGIDGFTFVPWDDTPASTLEEDDTVQFRNIPHIGLRYDPATGLFEQPPADEEQPAPFTTKKGRKG